MCQSENLAAKLLNHLISFSPTFWRFQKVEAAFAPSPEGKTSSLDRSRKDHAKIAEDIVVECQGEERPGAVQAYQMATTTAMGLKAWDLAVGCKCSRGE